MQKAQAREGITMSFEPSLRRRQAMSEKERVCDAFWNKKAAGGFGALHSSGDKAFSYSTTILQRLKGGKVIGNVTTYSPTTSRHQSACKIYNADIFVDDVARGVSDLSLVKPRLKPEELRGSRGAKDAKRFHGF